MKPPFVKFCGWCKLDTEHTPHPAKKGVRRYMPRVCRRCGRGPKPK